MPTLARASPDRELERLIRLYLRAETDIINEIGRLRSQGLVDYHAVLLWNGCRPFSASLKRRTGSMYRALWKRSSMCAARMPELCPARR